MKRTILNIFFFLFLFILAFKIIHQIVIGYAKESWQITEFLINYQGGFVRRGLLGEIILCLYNYTGLSPYILIISICIISYVALIWFIIKSFIKNGYTLFVLPFVFFLGDPIINNFWVRKDVLLILIFISIIYFSLRKSNWNLLFVNLFLIIGLLIHESIGFFCLPILFLILVSQKGDFSKKGKALIKSIITSVSQLIPSIFTFLCVLYFKGSQAVSSQIWESWKPVDFPIQNNDNSQIPTAIDGISWSLEQGLSLSMQMLKNFNGDIYAPIAWLLIVLIIYYIVTNISELNYSILNYKPYKQFNKANLSNILIFQLLTIIPLFILGWDYSRWVFYWITTSFAIVLLVPEKKLSVVFPQIILTISTKANTFLDLLIGKSNVLLLCLIIGFCDSSWGLINSINSGSVVIILQFFSKALHQLL